MTAFVGFVAANVAGIKCISAAKLLFLLKLAFTSPRHICRMGTLAIYGGLFLAAFAVMAYAFARSPDVRTWAEQRMAKRYQTRSRPDHRTGA